LTTSDSNPFRNRKPVTSHPDLLERLIDMAMTPCGLRPFEPQCLWYDVSNRLPSIPCVTGRITNGRHRQATTVSATALYPEPANDSIDNECSVKDGLRQVQYRHVASSASFLRSPNSKCTCMVCLSNLLTRANLLSPACPASLHLAHPSTAIQSARLRAREWLCPATERLA
jgi:hypothetical protein